MPFLKFSRDKRGYENLYLVEAMNRRGRSRSQILYWFRTPPNMKVGREPFDPAVRRALEAQYPQIRFDWPRLLDIHIPPPEVEEWRERRRAIRAAKQAAQMEVEAESGEDAPAENVPAATVPTETIPAMEAAPASEGALGQEGQEGQEGRERQVGLDPNRRRRRRRRGRRGQNPMVPGSGVPGSLTGSGTADGQPSNPEPTLESRTLESSVSEPEPEPKPGTSEPGTPEPQER